jgi:FlgD Ig-like domain
VGSARPTGLGARLRRRPKRSGGLCPPDRLSIGGLKRLAPTILVAALLVATATAFAVTEHLKLEDSPVLGTRFSGLFSPRLVEERIGFRLRREEDIRLDIADSNGEIVKQGVGSGVFGQAYHQFAWDGRDDSGQIVPDGIYRVQLTLKDEDRTIEFPRTITVDSTPPTIPFVTIRHGAFSPDGDGRADRVDVRYRFGEPAWAILYVHGKRVGRSGRRKPIGVYPWYARGRKPGEYRLALAAQDRAGNIAPSTREFKVRLRYVQLFKTRFTPRGRTIRVRVSSDAKRLTWRLGGRSGTGRPPLLRLPVPTQPGRYTLTVSANGHRARGTVIVR